MNHKPARNYYRVMLGRQSAHAAECRAGGFIGADFDIDQDLSGQLPDAMRQFNAKFIPVLMARFPHKSKISAGLACGALWTVSKGIRPGDVVLCPDGTGVYHVGLVEGEYRYAPGQVLPHRRSVNWLPVTIARTAMSEALRNSTGSIGTVSTISDYHQEIDQFLAALPGQASPGIVATDPVVEDPVAFAMEKHLEDFLVQNWAQTELAQQFKIYEEDGELVGQQYHTDAGPIDILAVSRDGKRLLVVELKRGRASDVVVGQILRYMGYVKEQIAEPHQAVEGAIIALDDDQKLRWALAAVPAISFYRYQLSFKLQRTA
ncbi:endonuclease NucS domain-containing protein [Pelomonas sp. BJYL3]|uniref:endonuclease NucS domain-containing protein n=1 Tax=Pelomonas sp. BJYL3 TaxID=2976697 RepID=UPI0022B3E840|nr:endonuclease NucS domain-containing protein [Pelomonas sp. BJYL3]